MSRPRPDQPDDAAAARERYLERRYGRANNARDTTDGRSRTAMALSSVVAVVVGAVAVYLALGSSEPGITLSQASYSTPSDSLMEITVTAYREDPSQAWTCAFEALDASRAQVGVVLVDIPPSEQASEVLTVEVPTLARGEIGRAVDNGCYPA